MTLFHIMLNPGGEPTHVSEHQQTCHQDIHAVLREMSASLAEQRVEMRHLQRENEAQTTKLKELDLQKTALEKQKTALEKQKIALEKQKIALEKQKIALEKQKIEGERLKQELQSQTATLTNLESQQTEVDKLKQQLQSIVEKIMVLTICSENDL
ncbi:hypothetical protein KUCAC02_012191 [Chaenocephalus aceratus]|uniref:Uncharacterized protein n=1 Tax=Chaenocephalus aceratus TaxID=36190 RepID=A0ACB9XB48_CHAAC|nr:hypothetical protein KUCAC02_012191 [Chaenocephalus aceratus]